MERRRRGGAARFSHAPVVLALLPAVALVVAQPSARGAQRDVKAGGVVRVVMRNLDVDSLDPALNYTVAAGHLVYATCAQLLTPDLRPDVAAAFPKASADRRVFTFRLRNGFRFSDGTPVRASAFERSLNRTLAPGIKSPWAAYTRDIVGADEVLAGDSPGASGIVARGNTLTVRLKQPVPDFPARTTGFLCAVPPGLPADPEGIAEYPAAGPYYVSEYRPGERVVLERNPYYGGTRPQHVDGFTVDLRLSTQEEVVDRVERGQADWGVALAPVLFDPARRLAAKYGVNKGRFRVQPGVTFRGYALNTSRPLFKDNPQLRRAVSYAIDRAALRRVSGGPFSSTLTDQYLPPWMAGFRDADIYPLTRPDLRRARTLAQGNTRSGKAVLFTIDFPFHVSFAQSVKQTLAQIGLEVEIKRFPLPAYFGRLMARGAYDLGFATWTPDYRDPYAVLNIQLDGQFIGATNWPRFDSGKYNRLLRQAALLQGRARSRAYGALDVQLAREAAPMVAIDYINDANLVSKRIGCLGRSFDLSAVCLK